MKIDSFVIQNKELETAKGLYLKYMKLLVWNLLLWVTFLSQAQIPDNYFSNPLKIPLVLSGTFGELRSNHFHSGLDIKTQGRTGIDVHAAAAGFVSRIKISEYGYGKALYVKHPNGYITVYAHLKKFAPKIEAYVKKKQYAKESYTIELYPGAAELLLEKDEVIALSGNTGGSGGPHLHYEIRDGQSRPMNPMLFGIDVKDTKKPRVNSIWLYPLNEEAHINGYHEPYRLKLSTLQDGSLKTNSVFACGEIGIGLSTNDQQNGASNKNGVFKIKSSVNGNTNFEMAMDKFSFSETRYLNRMIDYAYFKTNKSRITKLFIEANNPLSIYETDKGNGIIRIVDEYSYTAQIFIEDYKGNKREIIVPIEGKLSSQPKPETTTDTPFLAQPHQTFTYDGDFARVSIPPKALYENVALNIEELPNQVLKVHNKTVPLHKYMSLSFDAAKLPYPEKSYIGRFENELYPEYVGAKLNGKRLTARTREFGKFGVFTDSIAPIVKPVNFSDKKWISNNKTLTIFVEDKETDIEAYKATINGKFALMEYDYKTDTLVYDFDDGISQSGENILKLYVEDSVGNTTVYDATFFRK